jgi:hypothetical protein
MLIFGNLYLLTILGFSVLNFLQKERYGEGGAGGRCLVGLPPAVTSVEDVITKTLESQA